MKAIISKALSIAVIVTIMMQCAPLLGGMMTSMFGQYETLAESIVQYDENGEVQLNGDGAEMVLTDLGDKSQTYTAAISQQAQEVLDNATGTTEVSEEEKADLEQLTIKAKEFFNELGKFFS